MHGPETQRAAPAQDGPDRAFLAGLAHLDDATNWVDFVAALPGTLANLCCLQGRVITFYSLAQHCVAVSELVPPEHALAALLHDAHKAIVGDLDARIKSALPDYRALEFRWQAALLRRFGVKQLHPCVLEAHARVRATECRDLALEWSARVDTACATLPDVIVPMPAKAARRRFQKRRLYTAWDNLKDEVIFFKGVDLLEAAGVPPKHLMAYMLCGYDKAETWDRIWRRFHKMTERGIAPYPMVFNKARKDLVAFQRWVITGLYRVVPWNEYERETKSPESTAAFARAVDHAAL